MDYTLSLGAQYRPRWEADTGLNFVRNRPAARAVLGQRTRLNVTVSRPNGLAVSLALQDLRVWGGDRGAQSLGFTQGLGVHEAYAVLPLGSSLSARLGRQELIYDNQRLVGNSDFTHQARSFDVALMRHTASMATLDLFYARLRDADALAGHRSTTDARGDLDFAGIHSEFRFSEEHAASALLFVRRDWEGDQTRQTLGSHASGKLRPFHYSAEAYLQTGLERGQAVLAYLLAARAAYAHPVGWRPEFGLVIDYLSGDGSAAGAFDTLYGTQHGFYGKMDFFTSLPDHTLNLGLVDIAASAQVTPLPWLRVTSELHRLSSATSSSHEYAAGDTLFGYEADMELQCEVMQGAQLGLMGGLFVPGDGMRPVFLVPPDHALADEFSGHATLDVTF